MKEGFYMGRRENKKKREYNRVKIVATVFSFMMMGLMVRLFYIQVIVGKTYESLANSQRVKEIPIGIKRGTIYDTNMNPLTNRVRSQHMIIYPEIFLPDKENLSKIEEITGINIKNKLTLKRILDLKIKDYNTDIIKILEREKGLFIVAYEERYEENQRAAHLIGYINMADNKGQYGLERKYNNILTEGQEKKMEVVVDAQKRRILGIEKSKELKDKGGKDIITTIDGKIQGIVEEKLDDKFNKGSVVVLDTKTGNVLAMASRPNFNPLDIASYLCKKDKEFYNRAIQVSYPPGSIFKIVVTAAALEARVDMDKSYFCDGYEEIDEIVIKCHSYKSGGHGHIHMKEAFSKSCNSYFIKLGQEIGGENILNMARKLGFGKKTEIELDEESQGILPNIDYIKGSGIGNISIGQGPIESTLIQVAKMTNIVANDGIDRGVHLLKEIVDQNNRQIIEKYPSNVVIDKSIAVKLKKMMKEVVVNGTAKNIYDKNISIAGKTGSAQSTVNGKDVVHAWFTGFYPYNNPKYVVSICIEDGGSGGQVAAPLFKDIVDEIEKIH
jgi:peptidoglycan glycosyltransferase/penicillin-binding protein 2